LEAFPRGKGPSIGAFECQLSRLAVGRRRKPVRLKAAALLGRRKEEKRKETHVFPNHPRTGVSGTVSRQGMDFWAFCWRGSAQTPIITFCEIREKKNEKGSDEHVSTEDAAFLKLPVGEACVSRNFLDCQHTGFVHQGLFPQSGQKRAKTQPGRRAKGRQTPWEARFREGENRSAKKSVVFRACSSPK